MNNFFVCTLTIATALTSGGAASERMPSTAKRAVQCEAAAAALPAADTGRSNTLYSLAAPGPLSGTLRELTDSQIGTGWSGRTPKAVTAAGLLEAVNTSALSCPEIRSLAAQRGEVVSEEDGAVRLKQMGYNGLIAYQHRMSMAAVDPQGKEAIVALVSSSNQLAGGIFLVLLSKRSNKWEVVGRKPLALS